MTTVRRSFVDFMFLQKWLSYEQPFSWIPTLSMPRNPFSIPAKPSRQVIHDIEWKLSYFIRTLANHPTFFCHELLWEFLLIQDLSKDQIIERCRRKLENRKESQFEEYDLHEHEELDRIDIFFRHAKHEVDSLSGALHQAWSKAIHLVNKTVDYQSAYKIFTSKLEDADLIPSINYAQFISDLSRIGQPQNIHLLKMSSQLSCLVSTVDSVVLSLAQPISLIFQLRKQQHLLAKNRDNLVKLHNKSNWPLGMFEEKRERESRKAEDSIYLSQSEIRRLSSDIDSGHVTLASELGGFYTAQEKELRLVIERFASDSLASHKEQLQRLKRVLIKIKSTN